MDKPVLIDALYINNSGGKVLLHYLIEELESSSLSVCYLLDERIIDNHPKIKDTNRVLFLKATLKNRRKFYTENGSLFKKILCFGNLAPNLKQKAVVYTYLHQTLYIDFPLNINFSLRILFYFKRIIWNLFLPHTDYLIVQTNLFKNRILQRKKIKQDNIFVIPFFKLLRDSKEDDLNNHKDPFSYVYISNGHSYKNHYFLIESFCKFYDLHKKGVLILTITSEFTDLINLIKLKSQQGYPINNIGYVDQKLLIKVYKRSEFLIYPSLTESFGLGIVEAINFGCKVIGADLPYLHDVCVPSLTFDATDLDSMYKAFVVSSSRELPLSKSKVSNKVFELINLLR